MEAAAAEMLVYLAGNNLQEIVAEVEKVAIYVGSREMITVATILRDGEAPLMVLAMLTRHFRQLWRVKELCDMRLPASEIGKTAGINPYFIKGIMDQAGHYRISELSGIFERLFATDLALKTSGGKPVSLLECLLIDICGKPKP